MTDTTKRFTPAQRTYGAMAAVALVSLAAGYALSTLFGAGGSEGDTSDNAGMSAAAEGGCAEVLYWYDPMVPAQRFDQPGKSPFMDMQLVAKCAGATAAAGVQIDPGLVQNFGIRTAPAEFGVLETEIIVTGVLAYNGRDVAIVQPRAGGYVQRTYDRAQDDVVSRGAPLADILVPEWGGAQREYLAVLATGDEGLADAMRQRMALLGMSDGMINSVRRTGRAQTTITVTAPIGGAITTLGIRPGMTVAEGQTLAEITGFSPIWLEASVPEIQAADIRIGQTINAAIAAFPEERFAGRITAILPSADAQSRTITVRAELANASGRLKPGMFAQVSVSPGTRRALLVPSEAVIRTGRRAIVMLSQGEGGFIPAEVEIGRDAGGQTEVLAGLAQGEEVVVSGQFLLDSEASLSGLNIRPIGAAMRGASDGSTADEQAYRTTGRVTNISGNSITLDHSPVPELSWPAMVMPFALAEPSLAHGLAPGDNIEITFTQHGDGPKIESIKKAGR
jgi:Cu(I)/Ag(I) efflux system membrane fusion protein